MGTRALKQWVGDLALGLVPLSAVTGATWWLLDLPATYLAVVAALYLGMGALLVTARDPTELLARAPQPGIGWANRVTLGRATLAIPVSTLALQPQVLQLGSVQWDASLWWVIVASTLVMLLDGLDGRIARRTGTSSAFGARFDMELDALLLLALSWMAWQSGKVGLWVLGIGALRYLFVAGGWLSPRLGKELPESFRRKAVCVVQGVALLVCLGPIIPPWLAVLAAGGALGLLVYSFAVDVGWLIRRPDVTAPRTTA